MVPFYSPLRYPGGKNCVFPFVSKLMYENDLVGSSYAEPYAGGCGLALRLLFEGYVGKIYINDLDFSIYTFWKAVLDQPNELCDWIQSVEITMDNWHFFKEVQLSADVTDGFLLAKSTLFLNRCNVSGIIKGGVIGGKKQLGKYKIDARFNRKTLIDRIRGIASYKDKIVISNYDGLKFLSKIDKKKENIFIYLDPPYYQKGSRLYMNFYNDCDHEKLSKKVGKLKNRWMVSYDNHDFILNLYSGKKRLMHKLSQSASNRVGDEIFVFSDGVAFSESMGSLKSPVLYIQDEL